MFLCFFFQWFYWNLFMLSIFKTVFQNINLNDLNAHLLRLSHIRLSLMSIVSQINGFVWGPTMVFECWPQPGYIGSLGDQQLFTLIRDYLYISLIKVFTFTPKIALPNLALRTTTNKFIFLTPYILAWFLDQKLEGEEPLFFLERNLQLA